MGAPEGQESCPACSIRVTFEPVGSDSKELARVRSKKAGQLELGEPMPGQVEREWVSRARSGSLRAVGLPLLWCLCGSEDRCGGHRGPAGWGVPGCSFLFWLMQG